jgi:hypothetical protein
VLPPGGGGGPGGGPAGSRGRSPWPKPRSPSDARSRPPPPPTARRGGRSVLFIIRRGGQEAAGSGCPERPHGTQWSRRPCGASGHVHVVAVYHRLCVTPGRRSLVGDDVWKSADKLVDQDWRRRQSARWRFNKTDPSGAPAIASPFASESGGRAQGVCEREAGVGKALDDRVLGEERDPESIMQVRRTNLRREGMLCPVCQPGVVILALVACPQECGRLAVRCERRGDRLSSIPSDSVPPRQRIPASRARALDVAVAGGKRSLPAKPNVLIREGRLSPPAEYESRLAESARRGRAGRCDSLSRLALQRAMLGRRQDARGPRVTVAETRGSYQERIEHFCRPRRPANIPDGQLPYGRASHAEEALENVWVGLTGGLSSTRWAMRPRNSSRGDFEEQNPLFSWMALNRARGLPPQRPPARRAPVVEARVVDADCPRFRLGPRV